MTDAAAMTARVRRRRSVVRFCNPPSFEIRRPASPRPARNHYCREDFSSKRRAQQSRVSVRPSWRSDANSHFSRSVRSLSNVSPTLPCRSLSYAPHVSGEPSEGRAPARDTGAFPIRAFCSRSTEPCPWSATRTSAESAAALLQETWRVAASSSSGARPRDAQ